MSVEEFKPPVLEEGSQDISTPGLVSDPLESSQVRESTTPTPNNYFQGIDGALKVTLGPNDGAGPREYIHELVDPQTNIVRGMDKVPNGYIQVETKEGKVVFSSTTSEVDLTFIFTILYSGF